MVKYVYDAWGNHAVIDTNGNDITSGIGVLNPFRYRGYYYDTETELYYLQTRYYDPEVGRFISADDVSYLDPESIFGLNLYAYCNNDPVNYVDPSGRFVISIGAAITLGLVALFGITLGSVEATLHPIQNIADTLGYYISDAINSNIYSKDDISYSNNNIILALVLSDSKRRKSLALQDFYNWKAGCILAEANGYIFFYGVAFPEHQEKNSY